MNRLSILVLPLAACGAVLSSCVFPEDYYYGGPIAYSGYNGTYSTLPPAYYGPYYYNRGSYFLGGYYSPGRCYSDGRYYSGRYYHGGRYHYGGHYGHHGGSHHSYGGHHGSGHRR